MPSTVGDRSDIDNLDKDGRTKWTRFKDSISERIKHYGGLLSLADKVLRALKAYNNSGFEDGLIRAHTLHYVLEYSCCGCKEITCHYSQDLVYRCGAATYVSWTTL